MTPAFAVENTETPETAAKDNPSIQEIQGLDAQFSEILLQRLAKIKAGKREPALRGPEPTAEETSQIKANSLFWEAFEKAPVETLTILRALNARLRRLCSPPDSAIY